MKRRLLASLSVLFILSSINAQVFAANSSLQQITFNEYYSAIQDRFESYGIRWEGVSTNNLYPDYVYTQEDLNEALEQADEYCEAILSPSQTLICVDAIETSDVALTSTETALPKGVMYHTYTLTASNTITDMSLPIVPRYFEVQTTVDILTELLSYSIISVDEPTLRITAATGYDDYISLVSYDYSVSRNNTADAKVTVNITCEVKESVSIGGIESWAYVTKNYSVSFTPLKGL